MRLTSQIHRGLKNLMETRSITTSTPTIRTNKFRNQFMDLGPSSNLSNVMFQNIILFIDVCKLSDGVYIKRLIFSDTLFHKSMWEHNQHFSSTLKLFYAHFVLLICGF